MPALAASLKDTDTDVRGAAALALGRIGKDAAGGAEALAVALKDKDRDVRGAAALALSRIGKEARSAVPALRELLKDNDRQVQAYAPAPWPFSRTTPGRTSRH